MQTPVGTWWDRTDPGLGNRAVQSRHFAIRSDLAAERTRAFAQHLDAIFDAYSRVLLTQPGMRRRTPEMASVFIFATQQDYLETMRTQFGVNATGSGGMFFVTARATGLAFCVADLPPHRIARVLQHEGFHQFAYAYFGRELPPWLDEGLAEYFGDAIYDGTAVLVGEGTPMAVDGVRDAITRDVAIPFTDMLRCDLARWNARARAGNAAAQAMQAWSMVHFLLHGEQGRYRASFGQLLKKLNEGSLPADALRGALGLATDADIATFERRWRESALAARPGAFTGAHARLEFLAEGLLELWGAGARPATMEQLQEGLRQARFTHAVGTHGYTLELRAWDAANFSPPHAVDGGVQAIFELVPPVPERSAKLQAVEAAHPTPPTIRTRGLNPKEITLRWHRRADDPAHFDYELVTK